MGYEMGRWGQTVWEDVDGEYIMDRTRMAGSKRAKGDIAKMLGLTCQSNAERQFAYIKIIRSGEVTTLWEQWWQVHLSNRQWWANRPTLASGRKGVNGVKQNSGDSML